MSKVNVSLYSVSGTEVTLVCQSEHGLSAGDYFSVRNVNSDVNGQYFVKNATTAFSIVYDINTSLNIPQTFSEGYILFSEFNNTGKPGYIYNSTEDVWYQLSGKVNTNGNYTWTGTHLHQVPVTMDDILILNNLSASVSASPSGGGYLYVENGALKFMGGNGTITTIASA